MRRVQTGELYIANKYNKSSKLQRFGKGNEDSRQSPHTPLSHGSPAYDRLGKGFMSRLRGEVIAGDSCRIYGQLEIHKCQGDFHITARGHGYQVFGAEHLDHESLLPPIITEIDGRNQFYAYHR